MSEVQAIPDDRVFDDYPASVDGSKVGLSALLKAPLSKQQLTDLVQSVSAFEKEQKLSQSSFDANNSQNGLKSDSRAEEFLDESRQFRELSLTELQGFLDWMSSQSDIYNFVVVGKGENDTPITIGDITESPSPLPLGVERTLEDSWVVVPNNDLLASQFVKTHPDLQQKLGFFAEWPSFGVYSKVSWLVSQTGTAFCWGYLIGAKAALDSLYSLTRHPVVAGGVGLAAGYAAFVSPELILKALQYVVIGGLFGGASVAAPILVIGTSGIFVTASLYHAYVAAKRSLQSAVKIPVKPAPKSLQ